MGKSLRIDKASVCYGDVTAVQGASLRLEAGEIGCLLGPSGCGKTSLLRAISGFQSISEGTIEVGETLVSSPALQVAPEQRRIGMVFQDFALFPHLSVSRNIAFGLQALNANDRQTTVERLLELVSMRDWASAMPHELSGGQQQRVALARALAPSPDILLLDEPFSSLDTSLREQLALEVTQLLKESNVTAVLVTHDQQEALTMADTVAVMNDGNVEQVASPYELYHQPRTRFVAGFIGQGTLLRVSTDSTGGAKTPVTELASALGQLPSSRELEMLLRPDDVIVDATSNCKLVVSSVDFRGAHSRVSLQLPDGQTISCNAPGHVQVSPGYALPVRVEIKHKVTFDAAEGAK